MIAIRQEWIDLKCALSLDGDKCHSPDADPEDDRENGHLVTAAKWAPGIRERVVALLLQQRRGVLVSTHAQVLTILRAGSSAYLWHRDLPILDITHAAHGAATAIREWDQLEERNRPYVRQG